MTYKAALDIKIYEKKAIEIYLGTSANDITIVFINLLVIDGRDEFVCVARFFFFEAVDGRVYGVIVKTVSGENTRTGYSWTPEI